MNDFTFLTKDQIFGSNQIEVIKKRGTKAAISDFSVMLGGQLSDSHVASDSSLKGRTGNYWTKSDYEERFMFTVQALGNGSFSDGTGRSVGARPALPLSSLNSNIPTNEESGKRATDGVLEVEYGYYPQTAVAREMQEMLETAYRNSSISKTGNSYTTDSVAYNKYYTPFQPQTHQEYEYNGKRYVRVEANLLHDVDVSLSNGVTYYTGDNVWVEVEPVKWLVDENARMMITEKIIFAGVQFNKERNYKTRNFDRTDIKAFMDKYFSKDLVQIRSIGKYSQTNKCCPA